MLRAVMETKGRRAIGKPLGKHSSSLPMGVFSGIRDREVHGLLIEASSFVVEVQLEVCG